MASELWILPAPSTSLLTEPIFAPLKKRLCEISFDAEGNDGTQRKIRLLFEGVEAYKCTHMTSCNAEMIEIAYDKVADLGATPWLTELSRDYNGYHQTARQAPRRLRHLMIYFDDGPCYEFICSGFSAD